jgi:AraC-like DNA-binding protein
MSTYETHIMKDPQLPFILHKNTRLRAANRSHIHANWHENVEILYVTHGSGVITCDTAHHEVSEGDFVVINANCIHAFHTEAPLFIYQCLIVDRAFCLANHFDTNRIRFAPVFRDEEIARLMKCLHDEYTPPYRADFRVQMIRAIVLQIMARLCCEHSLPDETLKTDTHLLSCIKQAIGYIHAQSHRDLPLEEVATLVGLSKFYFAREFRRITDHTFVTYVNLVRCEHAKRLLAANNMRIGEIGRACGFENQSYFTRLFRKSVGMLPSEYRQRQLRKADTSAPRAD